jgi:hypothetical protein
MPRKSTHWRAALVICGVAVSGLGCKASGRDAEGLDEPDAGACRIGAPPEGDAPVCIEVCTSDGQCLVAGRYLGHACIECVGRINGGSAG